MTEADVTVGSLWRHKKRGSEYEVSSLRKLQCGNKVQPPCDGTLLVCYDATDPECEPQYRSWARPISEFIDGRFEKL